MQPLVEDIQPLVEGFLEEYNGIPYRQFFGHENAYERLGMEDIWNGFYLLFSMMFFASNLRTMSTAWQYLTGTYKDLRFTRKWAYMLYRISEPMIVIFANFDYCFRRFMAITTTAMLMWWTYPVFLFYKFFRGRSFDVDFDELDEEGKKYSQKQALVYHYWGDSRYQTWFASYKTHAIDFWVGVLGVIPWLIGNVIYWPLYGISILIIPATLSWKILTPWKENDKESMLLWWSGAVEAGIHGPMPESLYTNRYQIPEAVPVFEVEEVEEEEECEGRRC